MKNNLKTTNQNAKLTLNKSKNLLNITNSILSKKGNNVFSKNFQFKPYYLDNDTCTAKLVIITQDGSTIVSVSLDNTIKLWDVKSGEHLNTLNGRESVVSSLAVTPNGKFIIIGSEKGTIDLCEIKTGKSIRNFNNNRYSGSISSLKISSSGKYLVSISDYDYEKENYNEEDYESLRIWNIESGQSINTFNYHIHSACLCGEYLFFSYSYYETVSFIDIESGHIIDFLEGDVQTHSMNVTSLVMTPDGKTLISGGGDNQEMITVWDGYEEDNEFLYMNVSNDAETIKLWDIKESRYTKVLEGHTDYVYSLAITSDGKTTVSGSKDSTIKIWDIESGKCIKTLEGHTSSVFSVVISPDGKTIISRSSDDIIKVWDIQSGKCNYTIYNINDKSAIIIFSDGYFNASKEDINKFIRIDDTSTSCRKLTKEEIEHFCKVKYKHKNYDVNIQTKDTKEDINKSKIPTIDMDNDEIPF